MRRYEKNTSADVKTTTVETTTAKITTTAKVTTKVTTKTTTATTTKKTALIPYTYNDDIQLSIPDYYVYDSTGDADMWLSVETGSGFTIISDAGYQVVEDNNAKAVLSLLVSSEGYTLTDWTTVGGQPAIIFDNNGYANCAFFNGNCLYITTFTGMSEAEIREIIDLIEITGDSHSTQLTETPTDSPVDDDVTLGMKNALEEAKSYIRYSPFSYTGLIDQLEYEGYTYEECVYGADNCGADWYEQAVLSAESYIEYSAFSYLGLIGQLKYEGFTAEEAAHGADNCGADWYAEAAECAQSYMDYSSFSRQELLDQLLYEEFTYEEAEHGVQSVGY